MQLIFTQICTTLYLLSPQHTYITQAACNICNDPPNCLDRWYIIDPIRYLPPALLIMSSLATLDDLQGVSFTTDHDALKIPSFYSAHATRNPFYCFCDKILKAIRQRHMIIYPKYIQI